MDFDRELYLDLLYYGQNFHTSLDVPEVFGIFVSCFWIEEMNSLG